MTAEAAAARDVARLWQRVGEGRAVEPPPVASTLAHAARVYGLGEVDRDLLTLLLGHALGHPGDRHVHDLRMGELVDTLGRLHGHAAVVAALEPHAPLSAFGLIEWRGDGVRRTRAVALADRFWPRLIGVAPGAELAPRPADERLDALVLTPATRVEVERVAAWLAAPGDAWPTVAVVGAPGSGRGAIARGLAASRGLAVLTVDGAGLDRAAVAVWRREALWHQAALVVRDADRAPGAALIELTTGLAAPVFVTATTPLIERLLVPGRAVRVVELPRLHGRERAGIWAACLSAAGVAAAAIDTDFLGNRFGFTPARIALASEALGRDAAAVDTDAAIRLCRALPEVRVGGLAVRIDTPYRWDDLVVAPAVARELALIVTWGRHAPALFAASGPGARSRAASGLACLFHGPPGTGKTLAAQVIAAHLGLELYRVDLASVVDKYIGETEKRLDLLFREAEAAGVVLLFDEADALFTQRTDVRDARDRYANLETGFLLQRLEDHRGLTILASNHQRNLDAAFHRRLGVVVELALPGPADRCTLWRKLVPDALLGDDEVGFLAGCAEMSGGDIRNAVVFAVLYAQARGEALAMRHLVIGAWRELVRAGRLINPSDFGAWQGEVVEYALAGRP